ncbi:MAG: Mur ligase family protein, partial [Nocardioidaceae bacterium]
MEISAPGPLRATTAGRVDLARRLADAASRLSRRFGLGGGGVIGGRVLLAIAPRAVHTLSDGRTVVLVSGTNGKSTTAAMTTAALRSSFATDTNADGANLPAGLVQALAEGCAEHVVLETDEGWLPWTVTSTRPSVVVLLNLSRDQLHRHPEVLPVARSWRSALTEVPLVVANADDPAVVWAASAARSVTWVSAGRRGLADMTACPRCSRRLVGHDVGWGCSCGFARPEADWWVEGTDLVSAGTRVPLHPSLPGRVNIANAAMAVATATSLHVT